MTKIAIIEDNQTIGRMYGMKFEADGFEVRIAINGKAGVDLVKTFNPDIILLDIQMPEMDGLMATRKIREWEREQGLIEGVPIVALTAHALDSDRKACEEAGMDAFLSKPAGVQDLRQILRRFLPEYMPAD